MSGDELGDIFGAIGRRDVAALGKATTKMANLRDPDGMTPLMNAVLEDDADPSIVQLLLDRGASINSQDSQGWTALHFAARDQKAKIVAILLRAGAKVDPVDSFGDTPLWRSVMTFASDSAVIRHLLEHGADPDRKNLSEVSPRDIARRTGLTDIVALFAGHVDPA